MSETHLLQLLLHKRPSCRCKLDMEKVTCGVVVVLKQQCGRCEYRNQWKSHVNASVPAAKGLKGQFTQTCIFTHYLLTPMLVEGWVKCFSPQNTSGVSGGNAVAAESNATEEISDLSSGVKKHKPDHLE